MPVKAARSPRESLAKTQSSEPPTATRNALDPASRHNACLRIDQTRENLFHGQGDRSGLSALIAVE
jgi:hypothetical protein